MQQLTAPLRRLGIFLLPSFIWQQNHNHSSSSNSNSSSSSTSDAETKTQDTRRDTDYLDGIRGWAAFSVAMNHFSRPYYAPAMFYGYGYQENWHLLQLPFVRVAYTADTAVALFFVISGFALSAKAIQLMRSRSSASLLKALSSTTFRRAARLFIPTVVSSLMALVLQRAGLLRDRRPPGYASTFAEEMVLYVDFLRNLMNVWTWELYLGWYNPHLWTIPVEFRSSMVTFLLLLGIARCRMGVRIVVEVAVLLCAISGDRWDVWPFIWGVLLAELHYHRKAQAAQQRSLPTAHDAAGSRLPPRSHVHTAALYLLLVCGLYLGSFPKKSGCDAPGFGWLCALTSNPDKSQLRRSTTAYGGMMILTSISLLPSAQRPFTNRVSRYLGKISYSLYLTHGHVNRIFSLPFRALVWSVVGRDSRWNYMVGYLVTGATFVFLAFWLADVFMRAVDTPSVNFARWVEDRCVDRGEAGSEQRAGEGKGLI